MEIAVLLGNSAENSILSQIRYCGRIILKNLELNEKFHSIFS